VAADEINTTLDKKGDLEEVGTDKNAYGVFYVQNGVLCMNVFHEPVKYLDVAVHRNVNFVKVFLVCQIFFEVLHVLEQQIAIAFEILGLLFSLVTNMDDHIVAAAKQSRWAGAFANL
jgi:hypothetical protein